jgi:hypothetical protein
MPLVIVPRPATLILVPTEQQMCTECNTPKTLIRGEQMLMSSQIANSPALSIPAPPSTTSGSRERIASITSTPALPSNGLNAGEIGDGSRIVPILHCDNARRRGPGHSCSYVLAFAFAFTR